MISPSCSDCDRQVVIWRPHQYHLKESSRYGIMHGFALFEDAPRRARFGRRNLFQRVESCKMLHHRVGVMEGYSEGRKDGLVDGLGVYIDFNEQLVGIHALCMFCVALRWYGIDR